MKAIIKSILVLSFLIFSTSSFAQDWRECEQIANQIAEAEKQIEKLNKFLDTVETNPDHEVVPGHTNEELYGSAAKLEEQILEVLQKHIELMARQRKMCFESPTNTNM